MLDQLRNEIQKKANPDRAKAASWFFKTGEGQYGAGDRFIGLTVPDSRLISKQFQSLSFSELKDLLSSPIHEERLIALHILVLQMKKADKEKQKEIVTFYLSHVQQVNNWDLVDSSAAQILGKYLLTHPEEKSILTTFTQSSVLWERRIAMVATHMFIRQGEYEDALSIATLLLHDKEDLMHKAVGWMLREVGKNCGKEYLVAFLKKHYKTMPRTALRYAIEHFPEEERKRYLKGEV